MNKNVYKPIIKNFMGITDVRVVEVDRNEYVVCKDIFNALGLVDVDGTWNKPREKMLEFLEIVGKKEYRKTLPVLVKQGKSRVQKEVECLNIETVPLVITQFKPTARRGQEALDRWAEFMKFVGTLLEYHEVHKFIFTDKDKQKMAMTDMINMGGSPVISNNQVNRIMGKLILGEDSFAITKDELKIYQPCVTIDLLKVRDWVLEKFENAYMFTKSHKLAYDMTLKVAQERYNINITKEN